LVIFLVIGVKQGELPGMGEKKKAAMLEFRKSRESREN
jgi:hypothetical protein